jgi:hypothetical protein
MAATIRDIWDGRIFVTLTRNVNRGTKEMRLRLQDAQAAATAAADAVLTAVQVIGQAGVGGFLVHFEVPRESGWVCHPAVLKKSAEAVDCKRVVKHSLFKERKERAKSVHPPPPMFFISVHSRDS